MPSTQGIETATYLILKKPHARAYMSLPPFRKSRSAAGCGYHLCADKSPYPPSPGTETEKNKVHYVPP